jgi:hypothetical protein
MDFGYYPEAFDKVCGDVVFATLLRLDAKIAGLRHEAIKDGWYFAQPQRLQDLAGKISIRPYPKRVFSLPKTHQISHTSSQDPAHLDFIIQCFGFFVGMRMSTTEAGFLDATPIKPGSGAVTDILPVGNGLSAAIQRADLFWQQYHADQRLTSAMRGIIHSYLLAKTPTLLDYEVFIYLYTAIEGCHYVLKTVQKENPRSGNHGKRIERLCRHFSIQCPPWADWRITKPPKVTEYRNATLHEGLFFDEPLGVQIFGGAQRCDPANSMFLLEMANLVSRLIIALLGMDRTAYVHSPIGTRGMVELRP